MSNLKVSAWKSLFSYRFKRLSLLSLISIIFFILYAIVELGYLILVGHEFYLSVFQYYFNILIVSVFILSIYMLLKIPSGLKKKIDKVEIVFIEKKNYQNYLLDINRLFKKTYIIIMPIFVGILVAVFYLYSTGIATNFEYLIWAGEIIYFEGFQIIYFVIIKSFALVFYFLFTIVFSMALIFGTLSFICLNKIGTKKYPLNITYRDLRGGILRNIGDFILSIAIGVLIFAILWSILGFIHIYLFQMILHGLFYLTTGLSITIIGIIVLVDYIYHNHREIVKGKDKLLNQLLEDIHKITSQSFTNFDPKNFQRLKFLEEYFDRIENISDWSFNTLRIRELFFALLIDLIIPVILFIVGA